MRRDHLTEGELLDLHVGAGSIRRRAVARHIAGCDACRARFEDLGWLDATLAEWPAPEPPRDGLARVMRQIAEQRPRAATRPARLRGLAATFVGVLAGAGGIAFAGVRLSASALVAQLSVADPVKEMAGMGLAAAVFFGAGSLVTLALAPILMLELQSHQAAARRLDIPGGTSLDAAAGGGSRP